MNNLKEYIIEKLHLDKDIDIRNDYSDIEYILTIPKSSGFPEEYFLCKDEETTGNSYMYILSFEDLKRLHESGKYHNFYAYKINKDMIEYIDDIKDGHKQITRKDIFVSGTGDTFDNIIKKHK